MLQEMEVVKGEILVDPMHNKSANNTLRGYFTSCSVYATHTLTVGCKC